MGLHARQVEAINDSSRHKFFLTGRRGGKTTTLVESFLKDAKNWPEDSDIYYIGPTNVQSTELIWDPLENRLFDLKWRYRAKISKQRFDFHNGRKFYVIGAEKISRIRGHKVWRCYLDEMAYFKTPLAAVWKAVRPTLTDLRGRVYAATTPDGKGTEAHDFYLQALNKHNWKVFHWHTYENPGISREEIEEAKLELDEKAFRQEYMATWESFEGLAYYNFDENVHIKPCSEFNYNYPVNIALDFNVNPTTLIVNQKIHGHTFWRKEYSQKNSSTADTFKTFCEDFKDKAPEMHVNIYGDSTGSNRNSATGTSDYKEAIEILTHNGFRFSKKVPRSNPPVIDRVKYVNGSLRNVRGEHFHTIDPSCQDLIKDLSSQALNGRHPCDKNNLGHKADAFGYYNYWETIYSKAEKSRQIQL